MCVLGMYVTMTTIECLIVADVLRLVCIQLPLMLWLCLPSSPPPLLPPPPASAGDAQLPEGAGEGGGSAGEEGAGDE